MNKKYRSDIAESVHLGVSDLYEIGLVDKATMRRFDERCLTAIEQFGAAEIKALREREGASQAVLARYLNVTVSSVGQWERGEKRPAGAALKLLSLAKIHGLDYVR